MSIQVNTGAGAPMSKGEFIRYFGTDTDGGNFDFFFAFPGVKSWYGKPFLTKWLDRDTWEPAPPTGNFDTPAAPGTFAPWRWFRRSSSNRHEFSNGDGASINPGGSLLARGYSSSAVVNTTGHIDLDNTNYDFPPLYFNANGDAKTISYSVGGSYSCTLAPTLRFRVFLGSAALADVTFTCVSGATNRQWLLEGRAHCVSSGAGGTVRSFGRFYDGATDVLTSNPSGAVDTTITRQLKVTAQWGTAAAGNTTQATSLLYRAEN
jgi:hypothetical protein